MNWKRCKEMSPRHGGVAWTRYRMYRGSAKATLRRSRQWMARRLAMKGELLVAEGRRQAGRTMSAKTEACMITARGLFSSSDGVDLKYLRSFYAERRPRLNRKPSQVKSR